MMQSISMILGKTQHWTTKNIQLSPILRMRWIATFFFLAALAHLARAQSGGSDSSQYSSTQILLISLFWFIYALNIIAVIRYCRRKNIQAGGYIFMACVFGLSVWCCLLNASPSPPIVVVQTQGVAYQAYGQPAYGQPAYGQPYGTQGGNAPSAQP
jgi:hypothetical protein